MLKNRTAVSLDILLCLQMVHIDNKIDQNHLGVNGSLTLLSSDDMLVTRSFLHNAVMNRPDPLSKHSVRQTTIYNFEAQNYLVLQYDNSSNLEN